MNLGVKSDQSAKRGVLPNAVHPTSEMRLHSTCSLCHFFRVSLEPKTNFKGARVFSKVEVGDGEDTIKCIIIFDKSVSIFRTCVPFVPVCHYFWNSFPSCLPENH